jgi:hypothetical protein
VAACCRYGTLSRPLTHLQNEIGRKKSTLLSYVLPPAHSFHLYCSAYDPRALGVAEELRAVVPYLTITSKFEDMQAGGQRSHAHTVPALFRCSRALFSLPRLTQCPHSSAAVVHSSHCHGSNSARTLPLQSCTLLTVACALCVVQAGKCAHMVLVHSSHSARTPLLSVLSVHPSH